MIGLNNDWIKKRNYKNMKRKINPPSYVEYNNNIVIYNEGECVRMGYFDNQNIFFQRLLGSDLFKFIFEKNFSQITMVDDMITSVEYVVCDDDDDIYDAFRIDS